MVCRVPRLSNIRRRFLVSWIVALLFLKPVGLNGESPKSGPPPQTVKLKRRQLQILDDARIILAKASLSDPERQVRLNAIESVLTGTVAVADDDNPEVRNPTFWTLSDEGYVVAPNQTAAEAISDLWIVHDGDGAPVPRIWCYKFSSLLMARAYIKYFQDTGGNAGLAAINDLIGHRVFPNDLTKPEAERLWTKRIGNDNLLPGDQVWFDNPYFDEGSELIRKNAYQKAIDDGKPVGEAKKSGEKAVESLAVGEEGSNVFYLGNDLFARGAVSVVRVFRDAPPGANQEAGNSYEQVYTQKTFTFPRYQQHIIDDYFTVQAYMVANPGSVHPGDFQIKRIRSFVDPNKSFPVSPDGAEAKSLDRLIDALASRNPPPKLVDRDDRRVPRFASNYDWAEQRRVREALVAVLQTKTDAHWWRLREHVADTRYVLTASRNDRARNFTVGEFCSDFASADLSTPYARHLTAVVGRLPATFHPEDVFWKHEKEWSRARKPLHEIQIEICQQAIQQWGAVKGTIAGEDDQGHTYTSDEKARFVEAVTREIDELRHTHAALFLDAIFPGLAAPSGWEGYDEKSEP